MDDTKSVFGGQAFAETNTKIRRSTARRPEFPAVFGAVRWFGWVSARHPELSERARVVVVLLAELSRYEDAFPSLRWLSTHLGCSASSVRAAIREAEEFGIVRRVERFDGRTFSGGRQTSNSYEIVLHPGLDLPHDVEELRREEHERVIVADDESDPNQLDLPDEKQKAPLRPTLAVTRPRHAEPYSVMPAAQSRGPLQDSTGGPSEIRQGIKEPREKKEEKANSSRARDHATQTSERNSAAAFLVQLSAERALRLKQRFGAQGFGSLLFALKRRECVENPALAALVLERVEAAKNVTNPGGYFVRILRDEISAAQLAASAGGEADAAAANDETAGLIQRIHSLNEQIALTYAPRKRDELYQELHAAQDALRLAASRKRRGVAPAGPQASSAPPSRPSRAEATPVIELSSCVELSAELESLHEAKRELAERLARVETFDREAAGRIRCELEMVKARARVVTALLEDAAPDAEPTPAPSSPAMERELTSELTAADVDGEAVEGLNLSVEEVQALRVEIGAIQPPSASGAPDALAILDAAGAVDPLVAATLEKLGAADVLRPKAEFFRTPSQEELELNRCLQRAALLALREREAARSGAASMTALATSPVPGAHALAGPGLAKAPPERGSMTSEILPSAIDAVA